MNEKLADELTSLNMSKNSTDSQECLSNDGMDIDMADIVVIDEYDSTKNDETDKKVRNLIKNYIFRCFTLI